MAKLDETKEFIGFLKAIFITLIVINTSLIAWVFKNFDTELVFKLYIVNGFIFLVSFTIAYLFIKILKEIRKLKDL